MLAIDDIYVSHLDIISVKCEMINLHREGTYLHSQSYRLYSMIFWACFGAVSRKNRTAEVCSEAKLACVMLQGGEKRGLVSRIPFESTTPMFQFWSPSIRPYLLRVLLSPKILCWRSSLLYMGLQRIFCFQITAVCERLKEQLLTCKSRVS